jgi:hypothetical protein
MKTNESGDMKILGCFRRLLDLISAETAYNPSNPWLKIEFLNSKLLEAENAVKQINVHLAPSKAVINSRQTLFSDTVSLVRRSRNMLKSVGVPTKTLEDSDTFSRKILGLRKSKAKEPTSATPTAEATRNHSASQQSYEAILGNFRGLIEIYKNEPLYKPHEEDFKVNRLMALAEEMEGKNKAVSLAFVPLNNARDLRDKLLYTNEDSLCDLAGLTKNYVKAVFGIQSSLYKSLSSLEFKKRGR